MQKGHFITFFQNWNCTTLSAAAVWWITSIIFSKPGVRLLKHVRHFGVSSVSAVPWWWRRRRACPPDWSGSSCSGCLCRSPGWAGGCRGDQPASCSPSGRHLRRQRGPSGPSDGCVGLMTEGVPALTLIISAGFCERLREVVAEEPSEEEPPRCCCKWLASTSLELRVSTFQSKPCWLIDL